jgi:hypothetical protein
VGPSLGKFFHVRHHVMALCREFSVELCEKTLLDTDPLHAKGLLSGTRLRHVDEVMCVRGGG